MTKTVTKVGYTLSYRDPSYVRTLTLIAALESIEGVEVVTAINTRKGRLRYPETLLKLILMRFRHNPDVYLLGFGGGHELFLPVRLLTAGKPLIFDEFINLYEWLVEEHGRFKPGSLQARLVRWYSRQTSRWSRLVLTDTETHAQYSKHLHNLEEGKIRAVYVGTDEKTFVAQRSTAKNDVLEVLFYGNMLPLHGIKIILEAAEDLAKKPVHFTIIGGRGKPAIESQIEKSIELGANITYKTWIDYEDLPKYIANADVCLAGPFGNTVQSHHVITGKAFQFLNMGIPAIIGKIDQDDGFRHQENCILVSQGSSIELAKVIEWCGKNKSQLSAIGEARRQLYQKQFSIEAISEQLQAILKSENLL